MAGGGDSADYDLDSGTLVAHVLLIILALVVVSLAFEGLKHVILHVRMSKSTLSLETSGLVFAVRQEGVERDCRLYVWR